jgi:hypothetical protein
MKRLDLYDLYEVVDAIGLHLVEDSLNVAFNRMIMFARVDFPTGHIWVTLMQYNYMEPDLIFTIHKPEIPNGGFYGEFLRIPDFTSLSDLKTRYDSAMERIDINTVLLCVIFNNSDVKTFYLRG